MPSSNFLLGIIPYCTVTVYLSGTTTKATIYSDASSDSLTNPFTANAIGSWLFYASTASGQLYDVQLSGGNPPNQYLVPVTLTGLGTGGGGGGGGGTPGGPTNAVQINCTPGVLCGYSTLLYTQANGLQIGGPITGNYVTFGPQGIPPFNWNFNDQAPCTTFKSITASAGCTAGFSVVQPGPVYNVLDYGAVGNDVADDSGPTNAAESACLAGGTGVVVVPGSRTYLWKNTVNTNHYCPIQGVEGNLAGTNWVPEIDWEGGGTLTSNRGTAYTATSITVAANNSGYLNAPYYPAYSPAPSIKIPYVGTFTVSNTTIPGQWGMITGCTSTEGLSLNNDEVQVVESHAGSFTFVIPENHPTLGTVSDSCVFTTDNIAITSDFSSRFGQLYKNLFINSFDNGGNSLGVGILFGTRSDTGTGFENVQVDQALTSGFYFVAGGININMFSNGARSDGACNAVYWKLAGEDSFSMSDGSITSNAQSASPCPNGAFITLDNGNPNTDATVHATFKNLKFETTDPFPSGAAIFNLIGNPTFNSVQFTIDGHQLWNYSTGATPWFQMVNGSDTNVQFTCTQCVMQTISAATRFVNLPAISNFDLTGIGGQMPLFSYAPSAQSFAADGHNSSQINTSKGVSQLFGDVNVGQMWQYGLPASHLLYTDSVISGSPASPLPVGTTLYKGQILANPAYWYGANGNRYALDVVYQSGTTGTLSGSPTCTADGTHAYLTVSSVASLAFGHYIDCGTSSGNVITNIDRINLIVYTYYVSTAQTTQALSFHAPTLGPEIQLPTKQSGTPSGGTWSQGDFSENSAAVANGIAGYVYNGSGWDGIPLGDSNGKLSTSQIKGLSPYPGSGLIFEATNTTGTWSGLAGTLSGCSGATQGFGVQSTVSNPSMGESTSAATSGDCAGWGSTTYDMYGTRQPYVNFGVNFTATGDYSSNARIWLGLASCGISTLIASDNPASCPMGAIRYSTVAGDTVYQCVTSDGTSQTVTPIGSTAPSTTYTLMVINIGATSTSCTVGATTVTNSTHLPSGSGGMYLFLTNTTQANSATHLLATNAYGYSQNGVF